MNTLPIVIAGGLGSRLWPLSKNTYPKQFIKQFDNLSSFQMTLLRNHHLGKILVVVNIKHYDIVLEQIQEINVETQIIFEPEQKNTAPSALLSALIAKEQNHTNIAIFPADHYILDLAKYKLSLKEAKSALKYFKICLIGIKPHFPSIEYGYVKITSSINKTLYRAGKFTEKPSIHLASKYLNADKYFWNSGIYFYNTDFILKKAKQLRPQLLNQITTAYHNADTINDNIKIHARDYSEIEPISLDYALSEHINKMGLVEAKFKWHDLGSWNSLWNIGMKDKNANSLTGNIITQNVTNSYIRSDAKKTTIIGVDNIVVISKDNEILVSKFEPNFCIQNNDTECVSNWGHITSINTKNNTEQIKKLNLYQDSSTPLLKSLCDQNFLITKGRVILSVDGKTQILQQNESLFVSKNCSYKIKNIGPSEAILLKIETEKIEEIACTSSLISLESSSSNNINNVKQSG